MLLITGMEEMWLRFWENLAGRADGPLDMRLIFQPIVATFLAIRSGIRDARAGDPAFLWSVVSSKQERSLLIKDGWKDIGKVFIIACVLDVVYQAIVGRGIFPGEMLAMAAILAIVPYCIVRGPVNRIASRLLK